MGNPQETKRKQRRLQMALEIQITFFDGGLVPCVEKTRTQDVSQVGARFTISRQLNVGQLVHLCIKMPSQLRKYDLTTPHYQVWALVRYVRPYKIAGDKDSYEIGAAFIGKNPPDSFIHDPLTRYGLTTTELKDGLWALSGEQSQTPADENEMSLQNSR